ncbi:cation:proton antiporter [Mycolicibacterium baixiangningiae]|uniref:cation:proton antiporter n=1 Tax=Mycolicibacterium baixiangningiae TaxID=2761578 RepID=UPI0018693666|nr:cation:proton antiporter [Mycolicibacterium baixiangningiae]
MQSLDPTTLLLQLGILLAVAFLLGRLAERVGLPATTGELAAGLLLGPSVLGRIAADPGDWLFTPASPMDALRGIALFCGVLLIGVAGASVDLSFVRTRLSTVWLLSAGALVLPLVSTAALALLADHRLRGPAADSWSFAVFAGLALSVSAVPVIVKIFADIGVLHRNLSQLALSVAVIDDAVVWIGLSILAAVVHLEDAGTGAVWYGDMPLAVAAVTALVLIAVVARHAVTGAERDLGAGACCLVAAAFITLGAVLTDLVGLDSTLGAFVCGAIVAGGRIVPVAKLQPLRTVVLGVLAPLFLAVNALSADVMALRDPGLALVAVAAVVLAIASKSAGAYCGGRLARLGHPASMAVSSALNARGTVQLVVAAAGLRLGVISTEGFTILVLVALVTSAMAGPLVRRYMRQIPPTPEEQARERLVD